jgi:hypothetical protein
MFVPWSFTADTEEKSLVPVGGLLSLLPAERKRREALRIDKEGIFRPDGMVGDAPYRALPNGEVEALIQGGNVRFQSLDQLRSMMNVKGPAQDRDSNEKKEPAEPLNLDFREEIDGVPDIINPDGTITAQREHGGNAL